MRKVRHLGTHVLRAYRLGADNSHYSLLAKWAVWQYMTLEKYQYLDAECFVHLNSLFLTLDLYIIRVQP